ncbi:respiratory burst oxidase, partial [Thraustotheca clavata]
VDETMTSEAGTTAWTAPEVLVNHGRYNEKADVYSFGVVLSELDTWKVPYADASNGSMSQVQTALLVSQGKLKPSFRKDCPSRVYEIAQQCLAMKPEGRPTAAVVAYELRKLLKADIKKQNKNLVALLTHIAVPIHRSITIKAMDERLARAGLTGLMRRSDFDRTLNPELQDRLVNASPPSQTIFTEQDLYSLKEVLLSRRSMQSSIASNSKKIQEDLSSLIDSEHSSFYGHSLASSSNFHSACSQSQLSDEARIRFVFDIFDVDQQGYITRDGIAQFLATMNTVHHISLCGVSVADVIDQVFAKTDHATCIFFEDFRKIFATSIPNALTISSTPSAQTSPPRNSSWNCMDWIIEHYTEVQFLILYFLLNLIAAAIKVTTIPWDPIAGHLARLAKAMAQIVLVNAGLILLPMCRTLVTTLRNVRWLWELIPFDYTIEFHIITGSVLLIAALVHTIAWCLIVYYAREANDLEWQISILNKDKSRVLRFGSYIDILATLPIWTGVAMILCALLAVPFTFKKIRYANFNLFWLSHCLFIPFTVFLFLHGAAAWNALPQTQYYMATPIVLYLIERRYRVSTVFGGATKILKAHVTSDTTILYMKKPRGFHNFEAGMYLFLKVPCISRFEWHPFTISSCPEDNYLSVHVRRAGDWTNALYDRIQVLTTVSRNPPFPAIQIDGPIGTPSQDFGNYPAVVLIGAGIGVTPFASILKHLVHVWEEHRCPDCGVVQLPNRLVLRKIYFYWVTREQENLSWFRDTMQQLSEVDIDNRLEIQTYLTPWNRESVVAPLRMIQTFIQTEQNHDVWTGITSKQKNVTHFGRPNWKSEFERIGNNHRGTEVGVFLCGPHSLNRTVRNECFQFNRVHTEGTSFSYHSEKF